MKPGWLLAKHSGGVGAVRVETAQDYPSGLLTRYRRSIDTHSVAVYAIDASTLPGDGAQAKIGNLVQWALTILATQEAGGSASFSIFARRRLHQWFTGQTCACLSIGSRSEGPAVTHLSERLYEHPGFVEAEGARWDDEQTYLVAYYDPKQRTIIRSAPYVLTALPSNANLDAREDGEWMLVGVREGRDGDWVEDFRVDKADIGGRLADDREAIDAHFAPLYAVELLRPHPLQRIRMRHIHALPEIGSHLSWTITARARDLEDLERLTTDVYGRAEGLDQVTETAEWRRQLVEQPDAVRRLLRDYARDAVAHLRSDGALDATLGGSAIVRIFLQSHTPSRCVCLMATNESGRLAAINMLTDQAYGLLEDVGNVQDWVAAQVWEQLTHEDVPLAPLLHE